MSDMSYPFIECMLYHIRNIKRLVPSMQSVLHIQHTALSVAIFKVYPSDVLHSEASIAVRIPYTTCLYKHALSLAP